MRGALSAVLGAVAIAAISAGASCRSGARETRREGEVRDASPPSAPSPAPEALARAKAEAARAASRVPALAYAVVTRDREVVAGAVGRTDENAPAPASVDTVFEAASIAKTVVAVSVMQLVEERRLDLDADVGGYVGFPVRHPSSPTPITLRQLLTHRASILDRESELLGPRDACRLGAFLRSYLVADGRPRAAAFAEGASPGTAFRYSNVGVALAAYVAERAAGEPFSELSSRRLFVPLGMQRTTWGARSDACATGHMLRDAGQVPLPAASHTVYPVVDLYSSAKDLGRFARAVLRDGELDGVRVLAPSSVRLMLSQAGDDDQALGWQLRTFGRRRVAGHEGEDRGASTALFLDLQAGSGVVVLANGDAFTSNDPARARAVQDLLAELFDLVSSPDAD